MAGDQCPTPSTLWIHTGTRSSFCSEPGLAGWGPGEMWDLRVDETRRERSRAGWKPQGNADQMHGEGPEQLVRCLLCGGQNPVPLISSPVCIPHPHPKPPSPPSSMSCPGQASEGG